MKFKFNFSISVIPRSFFNYFIKIYFCSSIKELNRCVISWKFSWILSFRFSNPDSNSFYFLLEFFNSYVFLYLSLVYYIKSRIWIKLSVWSTWLKIQFPHKKRLIHLQSTFVQILIIFSLLWFSWLQNSFIS
jgi:hypothetical protein